MRIESLGAIFSNINISLPSAISSVALKAIGAVGLLFSCCYFYYAWQNRKIEAKRSLESSFEGAIGGDGVETVRQMLKDHPELIKVVNGSDGRTPLYLGQAIESRRLDIADCLLENKADIDVQTRAGTPLDHAVYVGYKAGVEFLLKRKANPNIGLQPALSQAISVKEGPDKFEIIKLLVNNGAEAEFPSLIHSPLFFMVQTNNGSHPAETKEIVQLMQEKGYQLREEEKGTAVAAQIAGMSN